MSIISPAANAALGKNTESSGGSPATESRQAARALRFQLQRHMWSLLPDRRRLQACHAMAAQIGVRERATVQIRQRVDDEGRRVCHYAGVARCASPWVCPVCAPMIAARRVSEIAKARSVWEREGGRLLLVTFTFRHGRGESLVENVGALRKARERMRARKPFRRLRESLGMVGYIGALEVTHGESNGWHPHLHEYWFVRDGVTPSDLVDELYPLWADACAKQGLGVPNKKRGVNVREVHDEGADGYAVQGNDLAATVAQELAGGIHKRGRGANHTMWELLILSYRGDSRAGQLWREYAEALLGRATLFWSQGLKDRFAIGELTDEEAAAAEVAEGVELCAVPAWHLVRRFRQRAELLRVAEIGGASAVAAFVARLQQRADSELREYMHGAGPLRLHPSPSLLEAPSC